MASSCDDPCLRGTLVDFNGSLSEVLLFDLYRQIYLTRQTGTLELSDGDTVKRISFRKGSVTFATTSRDSERLGNLLMAEGRITAEQLESVLGEARRGKRSGQILVERGIIAREELDQYIRRQQSELAISALNLNRGSFRFSEALPAEYEDVFIDLSTADIILEGARRIHDPAVIQKLLGHSDRLLRPAFDPLSRYQTITLSAQEGYVLSRFERTMSIAEVCRISALGETATVQALLGFVLAGILDYAETAETDHAAWTASAPATAGKSASPQDDSAAAAPDSCAMKGILEAATLYDVLGIAPQATTDEIRQAYFRLAKRYHPDKWSRTVPLEVAETAEKVFQSLETAYRVLASPAQRERYDRELIASQSVQSTPPPDFTETSRAYARDVARRAYEEGVRLFERHMYAAALVQFKEAVKLQHEIAPYHFHLARTLAKLPGRSREAEFHFRIAIHQSPWNMEFKKAHEKFKRNPGHHDQVESLFAAALADVDREAKVPQEAPSQPPGSRGHRAPGRRFR